MAAWQRPAHRPVRVLALLVLAMCIGPRQAAAQKFYPDDPLLREPAPTPAPDPGPRNLSVLLEAMSATFGRPGERHPGKSVIAAQGVNTLGDVLDGPWYVNRHGRTRMSLAELRRGSGDDEPPSTDGPWHVLLVKNQGLRPTARVSRREQSRLPVASRPARRTRTGDRRRDDLVALLSRARLLRPRNVPGPVRSRTSGRRDERHRRDLQRRNPPAPSGAHRSLPRRLPNVGVTSATAPSPFEYPRTASRWSVRTSCSAPAATTRTTSSRTSTGVTFAACRCSPPG